MGFADDYAITSSDFIFHHSQNAVGAAFDQVYDRIQGNASGISDEDALAADPQAWAREIAADLAVVAPRVDTADHWFENKGRVNVDCTGWPGISFSSTEIGRQIIRPGHRFLVTVSGTGDMGLLKSRLNRGGTGFKVDLATTGLSRVYEWPQALPSAQLQADVDQFLTDLDAGVQEISDQLAEQNVKLAPLAAEALAARQDEIRASRAYLGDLHLRVTRDPDADAVIPALPRRVPGPAKVGRPRRPPTAPGSPAATPASPTLSRPTLDEFCNHVVTVLGAVALGFERSPRRFASAEEEALRDFVLVTLNSHYEGAATGETFNGAGKTDILVRHGIDNAFIGECKFWGGEVKLAETFEQLLGYTTWQDNRLALILFVRNKKMQPVIDTTRHWIGARPEFGGWKQDVPQGQLRCTLRWEDKARKEGHLTIFLIHLPLSDADDDAE